MLAATHACVLRMRRKTREPFVLILYLQATMHGPESVLATQHACMPSVDVVLNCCAAWLLCRCATWLLCRCAAVAHTVQPVRAVSASPTDQMFATCSDDNSVKVWDLATSPCTSTTFAGT